MSDVVNENSTRTRKPQKGLSEGLSKQAGIGLDKAAAPNISSQIYNGDYIRSNFTRTERDLRVKLHSMGFNPPDSSIADDIEEASRNIRALNRAWFKESCPINERVNNSIKKFLDHSTLKDNHLMRLPGANETLILDSPGMAYLASLPDKEEPGYGRFFINKYVESYELINNQGVLHNPRFDRRTSGRETFHIADYGYPVPYDKTSVPIEAAARILKAALNPPSEDKVLPYTKHWGEKKAETFVSLLVNPLVVPEVQGFSQQEYMETLVLAPGGMVSNLDFIERIFGNAGNHFQPDDNLFTNPEHWTGDTSVIIFAPHLNEVLLTEMGIDSHILSDACSPDMQYYNNGNAFLLKIRDTSGVVITIIADNYFGLGKKTIMTDVSFAADRRGLVLQEHAGGAFVQPQVNLGAYFSVALHVKDCPHFSRTLEILGDRISMQPEGYGIDNLDLNVWYLPETAEFTLNSSEQKVYWTHNGERHSAPLNPDVDYFIPNGRSIAIVEEPGLDHNIEWKLVGRFARGTFIHKSDTVSGGGKSELAKDVSDLLQYDKLTVKNLEFALDGVEKILNGHYGPNFIFQQRFKDMEWAGGRPALDQSRSLASVEKLLTQSPEYTDEYNNWLSKISAASKLMLMHLHMTQSSGEDISNWRERFKTQKIDGEEGKFVFFNGHPIKMRTLRMGYDANNEEILVRLRPDVQISKTKKEEDDLTASIGVPAKYIAGLDASPNSCKRIVQNMEFRFFNRTDGACIRGAELKAERDIAGQGNYLVNFEPLPLSYAEELASNKVEFVKYSKEQQGLILAAREAYRNGESGYFCASDLARIIGINEKTGKPIRSPNPRYMEDDERLYSNKVDLLSEISTRLHRGIDLTKPVYYPVDVINPARRLNTTDITSDGKTIPHIAIYPPIIIQDLPELMMDLIVSVTGKSPSTTGGLSSEGAGTKGPFNCMPAIHYLNNQLKEIALTGEPVITTAAERIGPHYKIGHDLSIIIKEVLARATAEELSRMKELGYFELEPDIEVDGETIKGGTFYGLTEMGMIRLFGHICLNPDKVFNDEQLHPWKQNVKLCAEGRTELARLRREVARKYFEDGSIGYACPPLKALLHIMAFDIYDSNNDHPSVSTESVKWTLSSEDFRKLFTAEEILKSEWYTQSLVESIRLDKERVGNQRKELLRYLEDNKNMLLNSDLIKYQDRLKRLDLRLTRLNEANYMEHIYGSIGADKLMVNVPRT